MKCLPPCVRRRIMRWAQHNGYTLCKCGKFYQGDKCKHCEAEKNSVIAKPSESGNNNGNHL